MTTSTEPETAMTTSTEPVSQNGAAPQHYPELIEAMRARTVQRDAALIQLAASDERIAGLNERIGALNERVTILTSELTQAQVETNRQRDFRVHAERRYAELWEALGTEADQRGWCSEYDEFASNNGGPSRFEEISVTVRVAVTTSVPGDDLTDVLGLPSNFDGAEVQVADQSLDWSFELYVNEVEVRTGQCGCGEVSTDRVARDALSGVAYSSCAVSSTSCDNCAG